MTDRRSRGAVRALGLAVALCGACGIKTNQVSIGQKTSLESQLLGNVEPLSEEELLLASVRGPGAGIAGSAEDLQGAAIAARRRQIFNRDDIDELKGSGCVGEGREGTLVVRSCEREPAPELAAAKERLMNEENADRKTLVDWAIAVDPILTAGDRPKVVAIFRRMQLEKARPGDWVENDDGTWTKR